VLPHLASNLLYDTDQDLLLVTAEILHNTVWISARVYKSFYGGAARYHVWIYDWNPQTNIEKSYFSKEFKNEEEAKLWAIQLATLKNSSPSNEMQAS
jgi:hypothetical protein